jgi:DNA polymerase III subunit chi
MPTVRVEVLTGVSDRLLYACKFLRKSMNQKAVAWVSGPEAELQKLDTLLWTFDAHSFVPHAWAAPHAQVSTQVRQRTRIWLSERCKAPVDEPGGAVLVNLPDEVPEGWQAFARVVEFVGDQEQQIAAGRRRWKDYGSLPGVERIHHAVKD